ncbi:shikimate kinase [Flavobacterium capsici]|uniref:Shikimate kinase n=1 Tax=Flavobacterium capsici TaxID=3075618 RepID=A0AA96EUR7_9FLAO|nr:MULTISPECIES: shikimate kinase [unclassified Flavobacterium]WNM18789.1 shikimate kinase [Flavobacterium sp. PMR2A8]WNM22840.1 shikimate kinase [Flavobacterium sp. PMTSA4]
MLSKIILVGYMGVGKTTIGKELGKITKIKYLDLDEIIEEKENLSIEKLFSSKGELYFRKLEHQLFEGLINNNESFILSTGGGTPCYYNNHLFLENKSVVSIYLEASINTIFNRLVNEQHQRPIIKDLNEIELKEFIGKHLFERSYYYLNAHHKIKVDDKDVSSICKEITSLLL